MGWWVCGEGGVVERGRERGRGVGGREWVMVVRVEGRGGE